MKLSTRELTLGWATFIVVLVGFGYWYGEPKYKGWKESQTNLAALEEKRSRYEQIIQRGDVKKAELAEIAKKVPTYPKDEDIRARYLRTVQQKADPVELNILRQEPGEEEEIGELRSLAVNCAWEGELEALVRFLYALQIEDKMVDFQELSISPSRTAAQRLKGNFEVHFAYKRNEN